MKWVNHVLIAGSVTAVWRPELAPLAVVGATAPDWMEWVAHAAGRRVKHRTSTHIVAYWLFGLAFGLFVWNWHYALTAFSAGGLSHVLADACTVQGVPLGWWSDRRFHLFGGRFKTGRPGEYLFAGGVVLACFGVAVLTRHWGGEFSPFFFDWADYYHKGLIDAAEWLGGPLPRQQPDGPQAPPSAHRCFPSGEAYAGLARLSAGYPPRAGRFPRVPQPCATQDPKALRATCMH